MILESNKIDYCELSLYLKSLYYEMYKDTIDWTVTADYAHSDSSFHINTKTDGLPRRAWVISKNGYKSWLRNYKLKRIGIK